MTTADLVLRGGLVVDGSGDPGVIADVAVRNGEILAVGRGLAGERELDVAGQVVAPGFIDIHTHFDAQVLWDGALTPSCWHGVTSVVLGNCGYSLAPCRPEHHELMIETLEYVEAMSPDALRAGIEWDFETFPEYLAAIDRRGVMLNVGVFVGHTALRLYAMGDEGYERAATADEIARMSALVEEAMEAGAIGFSSAASATAAGSGGRPVPSRHATYEEFRALASAVGRSGRGWMHIAPGPSFTVEDVYRLQPEVGCPITWQAILTGYDANPMLSHRGAVQRHLEARAQGIAVSPQMAVRPIVMQFQLSNPFHWVMVPAVSDLQGVSMEERMRRYGDPEWRAGVQEMLDTNDTLRPNWSKVVVDESERHPDLVGRSLADVAAERGVQPIDVACAVAVDDGLETRFRAILVNDDQEAIGELLKVPGVVLGLSDAGAHGSQLCDACFTTDLLKTYVRERGALTVEAAVRKLTGELADTFGITGRGYLRPGYAADICVFDPQTVGPGPLKRVYDLPAGADRLLPNAPSGISHVFVNGVSILDDPDARPGQRLVASTRRA